MSELQPPQLPFSLNQSAEEILRVTHAEITASRARLNAIVKQATADYNIDNFILPLAEDENIRLLQSSLVEVYQYLSPEDIIREASRAAAQLWSAYDNEVKMRKDIFAGLDAIYQQRNSGSAGDAEIEHYLNRLHRQCNRNGIHLTGESREAFQKLKSRMDRLCNQCRKNLQEGTGGIWFTHLDLKGVPHTYLNRLKRNAEGRYFVGLKLHDMNNIFNFATDSETRKRLFIAAENQCPENIALFEELIKCRAEVARLIGTQSFAEYTIEGRMLTTAEVYEFLHQLKPELVERAAQERKVIMKTKKKDLISQGQHAENIDDRIYLWDLDFYVRKQKEITCDFEETKLAEYFPLQHTLQSMLAILERLLRIRIQSFNANVPVWHESVTISSVWDDESSEFLGFIYFDLLERPGKYNSNCNIPFAPGFLDGGRNYPSIVLSTTFSPPALLRHREVVTLFHELGHSIHYMLGRTRFASTYGTGTAHDFVEIPSMMLENWCWAPSILYSLAGHYTSHSEDERLAYLNTHNELPDEKPPMNLLERVCMSRSIGQASQMSKSLHLALFDLMIHGSSPENYSNISELYNKLRTECTSLLGPESQGRGFSWGSGHTRFRHILGGYAAGYYCYILGTVYSRIMFNTRFQQNPVDPTEGYRYRRIVLEKGGSLPELPLLKEFVGGELDPSSFSKML